MNAREIETMLLEVLELMDDLDYEINTDEREETEDFTNWLK